MFWPDVVGLKQFYASPCGVYTAQLLRLAIRRFWPDMRGELLIGIGFTTPYFAPYLGSAARILACMPAGQGVVHWPSAGSNCTILSDEALLPLADNSVQRLLVVHALEHTESPRAMLDECWRVLAPGGRLLMVVPNRRGMWVRASVGPFSTGRGFSPWQLRSLLAEQRFTTTDHAYALYIPPTQRVWWLKAARFIEGFGRQWFRALGGVVLIEAEKQLVQPIKLNPRRRLRSFTLPEALPSPVPVPALGMRSCIVMQNIDA